MIALRRPRAFWISLCNVIGLLCSLAGLLLLFYFALPNEVPGAPSLLATGVASPGWEKEQRRYSTYAHVGLALALAGTIMEAVPSICTAIGSARRRHRASSSADNMRRHRNEMPELLDMFADGSGFGDPDARRNAEQRLQAALAKDQQIIGNRLNWLTFLLVVVGLLNAAVLTFQVWHR